MYSFTTRVRYSELAENRSASLVAVINYFQDCCTFESEARDIGLDWLREHKTAWMLTGWQIKIDRMPRYCEDIRVTTWACGFRHFIGKRNFTIENVETGELLVYAYSEWAYVNTETGMPERNVPEKELTGYGISDPLDKEFEKGRIQVPDDMTSLQSITVSEINLDTNHHVNNAQYMALALAAIPKDKSIAFSDIRNIKSEYRQQSVLGDVLYPKYRLTDSGLIVVLDDAEGHHKLVAELG